MSAGKIGPGPTKLTVHVRIRETGHAGVDAKRELPLARPVR